MAYLLPWGDIGFFGYFISRISDLLKKKSLFHQCKLNWAQDSYFQSALKCLSLKSKGDLQIKISLKSPPQTYSSGEKWISNEGEWEWEWSEFTIYIPCVDNHRKYSWDCSWVQHTWHIIYASFLNNMLTDFSMLLDKW